MNTVPNQKVIITNKEQCDKNHLYTTMNINALQQAMEDLNNTAFKFWIYCAKNQDKHMFAFSPTEMINNWGFKKTQIYEAKKELESKGYLVKKNGNTYEFYEVPQIEVVTEELQEEEEAQIEEQPQKVVPPKEEVVPPRNYNEYKEQQKQNQAEFANLLNIMNGVPPKDNAATIFPTLFDLNHIGIYGTDDDGCRQVATATYNEMKKRFNSSCFNELGNNHFSIYLKEEGNYIQYRHY